MTKPLIQQLAGRAGVGADVPRFTPGWLSQLEIAKLLFELCAYLDEQSATAAAFPLDYCGGCDRCPCECSKRPVALEEAPLSQWGKAEVDARETRRQFEAVKLERDTALAQVRELEAEVAMWRGCADRLDEQLAADRKSLAACRAELRKRDAVVEAARALTKPSGGPMLFQLEALRKELNELEALLKPAPASDGAGLLGDVRVLRLGLPPWRLADERHCPVAALDRLEQFIKEHTK